VITKCRIEIISKDCQRIIYLFQSLKISMYSA